MANSIIADIKLSDQGLRRLEWARERMPILTRLEKRLRETRPFESINIGICLHVEPKTGIWLQALCAGGATISITGSPGTTGDDVAAALVKEYGISVFARNDETFEDHLSFAKNVLESEPDLISDNGADLHELIQTDFSHLSSKLIGATEETTSGGFRLREELAANPFPTIVINDSRAKRIIENRYGVGQSVIDGIMRATNALVGGLRVTVIGYGYCGRGVALCFRNLGAHVTVVELDPLTKLDAHLEGFEVLDLEEAISDSGLIVTVTGRTGILESEHFSLMKDGAMVANAGHFEFEIDVEGLRKTSASAKPIRENIESFTLRNGKKIFLLGKGRPINLSAGEGNPIEVMDLGLALQTLSLVYLVENGDTMKNEAQNVPAEVEREVSEMALEAWTR